MQFTDRHAWDVSTTQARELQTSLAGQVDTTTPLGAWELVAAADVSYNKFDKWLFAAVVVVRAGTLELVERVGAVGEARFPYVPGLLSFREAPAVLEAFSMLTVRPDVVLCDGQGYAHPRRFGLACHLENLARCADDRLRQVVALRRLRRAGTRTRRIQPIAR